MDVIFHLFFFEIAQSLEPERVGNADVFIILFVQVFRSPEQGWMENKAGPSKDARVGRAGTNSSLKIPNGERRMGPI